MKIEPAKAKAIIEACGIEECGKETNNEVYALHFEDKLPTGTGKRDANLDVALISQSGNKRDLFFESKFLEPFEGGKKNCLKQSYLDEESIKDESPHIAKGFVEKLPKLEKFLNDNWKTYKYDGEEHTGIRYKPEDKDKQFNHIDAAQLIKHLFGLMNKYENDKTRFALVYIYFDDECHSQKKELDSFNEILDPDVCFTYVSYQDFIESLIKANAIDEDHINYLTERYLKKPDQGKCD